MNFTWTSLFQWKWTSVWSQYILPVSLFNGRWRVKATNTPMGLLHTFMWREKFTWSSLVYPNLSSMEGDVWRLQTLHTWAYFTLSLEERSSREVHSVYTICQWKVMCGVFVAFKRRLPLKRDTVVYTEWTSYFSLPMKGEVCPCVECL